MVLPPYVKVSKLSWIPDLLNSPIRRLCESRDIGCLRRCIQDGHLEDTGWRRENILHFLCDIGESDLMHMVVQLMYRQGILTQYINQRSFGGKGIAVVVEGENVKDSSYVWFHALMDRTSFLGLQEGETVRTADILHVFSIGRNGLRDVDVQAALSSTKVDRVLDTTPLALAVLKGHTEIVQMLIHYGAAVNIRDAYGNCPRELAAASGHLQTLVKLNAYGISIQATNSQLKSMLTVAKENRHYNVANYIAFYISRLRRNFEEWSTTTLADAITGLQNTLNVDNVQKYFLECALKLRLSIIVFLNRNFVQEMNMTSSQAVAQNDCVLSQQYQEEETSVTVVGHSWSVRVLDYLLEDLIPLQHWIDLHMRTEHMSGKDMKQQILHRRKLSDFSV